MVAAPSAWQHIPWTAKDRVGLVSLAIPDAGSRRCIIRHRHMFGQRTRFWAALLAIV